MWQNAIYRAIEEDPPSRYNTPVAAVFSKLLLRRRRTLNGDACCPRESGCPPQLLQVAIELVPQ